MCNRITYNSKTFRCHVSLYFFSMVCCLISITAKATSVPINVYLKLTPNNQVISLIKQFNQLMQQDKLLSAYHIKPFILTHPLHITLYLATYEKEQIGTIIKKTQSLTKAQNKIKIAIEGFQANPNGYVMLTVQQSKALQQLSNQALHHLAKLRDINAPIPLWAEQDQRRREIFKQWGSPNVMDYYQPHFSIFDPDHLDPIQRAALYQKLQLFINQFCNKNQVNIKTTADAIGVGIANNQGQIVHELASFHLN